MPLRLPDALQIITDRQYVLALSCGGTGSGDEARRNGVRTAACDAGTPHRIDGEKSSASKSVSLLRTVGQRSKAWNIC